MTTLIVLRYLQVGDLELHHGEELPPDLLPREAIDLHLDRRQLAEYDAGERRSIYRLLHRFSGCSQSEQLTTKERTEITL
jgi:hypothetical protein